MIDVSIVGGSGYTGGEALRILLGHSEFRVKQVTSESNAGKFVHLTHPNLRGVTKLKYASINDLEITDWLILCLPHGESQNRLLELEGKATYIADLASDFRLRNATLYEKYYGEPHRRPDRLGSFVYSVPELYREQIRTTKRLAGTGCIAVSAILALDPLFKAGVVKDDQVIIDAKIGSSAAGASPSPGSHHPERAGTLRSFRPTGHRHTAEISENLVGTPKVFLSATATDAVRGILSTSQLFLKQHMTDLQIRTIYRDAYQDEPFVRIVKETRGIYRYPEPKLVAGTNFVDIGFELEEDTGRLVVMSAIDNLVRGSAGQVIQGMNIIHGFDERLGLEFPGLHPV
ncbi:MAG TPA: N-acetyl-gamma-glutamyl-phosphate reductase [Fimbriimonadaceae bacterium]|nr:N-acetyl-gamma-glutamyl-phosphate reductase [Fimbriimonadaceae bacterium]